MRGLQASIVVPAYNQKSRLEGCINSIAASLRKDYPRFEIILAEDGSTDGSYEEARRLARKHKFVSVSHAPHKLGRGRALCRAFSKARGKVVAYIDADQATETRHLSELLAAAERTGIATGSRYLSKSDASRSAKREFFSRSFNLLVRLALGSRVRDHQCGFKAFRKDVAARLCGQARERHWFWDTEVLVLAQRQGLQVAEIPVVWREQGDTTMRLRNDILEMFKGIIRLYGRLNFGW